MHPKNRASAASTVFISCRKRFSEFSEPVSWMGFGGTDVQQRIQKAVKDGLKDFKSLKLSPVDEMVASYCLAQCFL